jgi:hypothetical protein
MNGQPQRVGRGLNLVLGLWPETEQQPVGKYEETKRQRMEGTISLAGM